VKKVLFILGAILLLFTAGMVGSVPSAQAFIICDVTVHSTDSAATIQTAIDGMAASKRMCFAGGTYHLTSELHPSQNFQGFTGNANFLGQAVLDGSSANGRVFADYLGTTDDVFEAFEITNYPAYTLGGDTFPEYGLILAGTRWVVNGNYIHDNAGSAIGLYGTTDAVVEDNTISDNGCGGIMSGGTSALIEWNYVSGNGDPALYDTLSFSCGGGKFHGSLDATFSYNTFIGNSRGFWFDGTNTGAVFSSNEFYDNVYDGLMLEIDDRTKGGPSGTTSRAWSTKVLSNTFHNNGWGNTNDPHWLGAAIEVSATNGVDIEDNTFDGSTLDAHVITLNQYPRTDQPGADLTVNKITVKGNNIKMNNYGGTPTRTGFFPNTTTAGIGANITWDLNYYCYPLTDGKKHFGLSSTSGAYENLATWTQWRAAGFDAGSTRSELASCAF